MGGFNRALVYGCVSLSLAGCAGTDFVRPNEGAFKLGQATSAQVLQQMGQPTRTAEMLRNEKPVKAMTFVYAAAGGDPLDPGVTPARAQSYYFYNDMLVGREFISSFKSDNSNFDEAKIGSIVKGKTRRADVVRLLGRPSAAFLYPMVKQTRGEAIGYAYSTTSGGLLGGFKFYAKSLKITFDEKDAVSDIDYAATGSRPN